MNINLGPKAKMWVAGFFGTIALVNTFITTLQTSGSDNNFSTDDVSSIAVGLVTLITGMYGVWKVENRKSLDGDVTM